MLNVLNVHRDMVYDERKRGIIKGRGRFFNEGIFPVKRSVWTRLVAL